SPTSARILAARTVPSPGAEVSTGASVCWENCSASASLRLATAACIWVRMSIRVFAASPSASSTGGWLSQRWRLELGKDPLDQVWIVASAAAVQQGNDAAVRQSLSCRGGGRCSQDGQGGLVVQV